MDTGQAGIFLHPKLAMVNHSCVPNAAVSFSGRKAFLRAELPIKEGDEVTISYIGKPQALTGSQWHLADWPETQTIQSQSCSAN